MKAAVTGRRRNTVDRSSIVTVARKVEGRACRDPCRSLRGEGLRCSARRIKVGALLTCCGRLGYLLIGRDRFGAGARRGRRGIFFGNQQSGALCGKNFLCQNRLRKGARRCRNSILLPSRDGSTLFRNNAVCGNRGARPSMVMRHPQREPKKQRSLR